MNTPEITDVRKRELEGLIARARNAYYNPDGDGIKPEDVVSDELYDAWFDELSDIEADNPAVRAIGAPPETARWATVAHHIPMGSLNKVNTLEQLTEWVLASSQKDTTGRPVPGVELLVTEKLDGISIDVKYKRGKLVQAITRGDGLTGEDITRNVAKMKGVPAVLGTEKFTGALRGEIVLFRDDLTTHFPDKKSTRNAAGGVAKRTDGVGCEHLYVFFYQVAEGQDFETEGQQFEWLQSLGLFIPNWYVTAMVPGIKTPHDLWVEYQQSRRAALEYDIDGLVVRVNKMSDQIALGEHDGRPHGAVAFKFASINRETPARGCLTPTGGTGRITPVAVFDPIVLLGAQVTQASLYNWRYIREIGFDVGARVLVARANDVIPRVVAVTKGTGTTFPPPSHCGSCGASVIEDGEYYVCPNTAECPAQAVGRLKRFTKCHDMLGWGDTLLEKLVDTGLAKSVPDLYRLSEEQLGSIDRMGSKSAQKVLKTLWAKNPLPIEDLLGSLSIPLCGKDTIQMLTQAGIDTLSKMRAASAMDIGKVSGIGPVKAQSLFDWFQKDAEIIEELAGLGVAVKDRAVGSLTGKTFCFTGSSKLPRNKLVDIAEASGAIVKGSVTKNLSFLVMADPNLDTTKARAARKNGTQCISEEAFLTLAGYDASNDTAPTDTAPENTDGLDVAVLEV